MKRRLAVLALALAALAGACSPVQSTPGAAHDPGSSVAGLTAAIPAGTTGPSTGVKSGAASGPFTLVDALGRTISFDRLPMRIAIAGKASFLVADAVYMFPEASSRVVALARANQGKTDFISVIDKGYETKTILDSNAGAEEVAAAKPHAVVAKSSSKKSLGDPLEALGIKVVYVDFETPEQYTRDLAVLGALFGDPDRAAQLTTYFNKQVSRVKGAVAGLSGKKAPDVLLVSYSSKDGADGFQVPPMSYIQTTELTIAGGNAVWKEARLGSGWTTINLEQIAVWNPDQVYVIAYFDPPAGIAGLLLSSADWKGLDSVKSKSIYGFPGDYYSWDEPDPRWVLGMVWLAIRVNPELSGQFDMNTEVRDFYGMVYSMDDATFDRVVKPHLPPEIH